MVLSHLRSGDCTMTAHLDEGCLILSNCRDEMAGSRPFKFSICCHRSNSLRDLKPLGCRMALPKHQPAALLQSQIDKLPAFDDMQRATDMIFLASL